MAEDDLAISREWEKTQDGVGFNKVRGGGSTHCTNGSLFGKWQKRLCCSPCPSASRVPQTQKSPKTPYGPDVRYQRPICFLECPVDPVSSRKLYLGTASPVSLSQ